jgi:hypothetical protein
MHGAFNSLCGGGSNADTGFVLRRWCPNLVHLSPHLQNARCECVAC